MLKFLGLVFSWYNVHKCFFPCIQRRILHYVLLQSWSHRWVWTWLVFLWSFEDLLHSSNFKWRNSRLKRIEKPRWFTLVSSQNHLVLGFWFVYPQAILYGFCCTFCPEFSLSNIILHQFLFQGRQMGTKQQAATTFCAQVLYKRVTWLHLVPWYLQSQAIKALNMISASSFGK